MVEPATGDELKLPEHWKQGVWVMDDKDRFTWIGRRAREEQVGKWDRSKYGTLGRAVPADSTVAESLAPPPRFGCPQAGDPTRVTEGVLVAIATRTITRNGEYHEAFFRRRG